MRQLVVHVIQSLLTQRNRARPQTTVGVIQWKPVRPLHNNSMNPPATAPSRMHVGATVQRTLLVVGLPARPLSLTRHLLPLQTLPRHRNLLAENRQNRCLLPRPVVNPPIPRRLPPPSQIQPRSLAMLQPLLLLPPASQPPLLQMLNRWRELREANLPRKLNPVHLRLQRRPNPVNRRRPNPRRLLRHRQLRPPRCCGRSSS